MEQRLALRYVVVVAGTQQDPSISRIKNKSVLISCNLFPSPDTPGIC